MIIRSLDPGVDAALVRDPFSGAPPGGWPEASFKLGLLPGDTRLGAIADLGFDCPEPGDAYVGLPLVDANPRGLGLGRLMLTHLDSHRGVRWLGCSTSIRAAEASGSARASA